MACATPEDDRMTRPDTTSPRPAGSLPGALFGALLGVALWAPSADAQHAGPGASATYSISFEATWSAATHPGAYPSSAHFSPLVGAPHDGTVSFWTPGAVASEGIERMAELGATDTLADEIEAAGAAAGEVFLGALIFPSPGGTSASFTVSEDRPLVTAVSMIAPSPDWFVGVTGLSLRVEDDWVAELVVELQPWDAGTDDGTTFFGADADTHPPDPILPLGAPFTSGVPLGRFVFTRTAGAGAWEDLGQALAGTHGEPQLSGLGLPAAGNTVTLSLGDALENTAAALVIGLSELGAPLEGGTLVPALDLVVAGLPTGPNGELELTGTWPAGVPADTLIVMQHWVADPGGPFGWAASNAICTSTP